MASVICEIHGGIMCIQEVSVPNEVLQKAEVSEMRERAKHIESGKYLKNLIRRINLDKSIGGNYGKYSRSF